MPGNKGGYDVPYHAGSVPLGRNKEITDDFSLLGQVHEAVAKARTSTKSGPLRAGDYGTGKKVVTDPPLSV